MWNGLYRISGDVLKKFSDFATNTTIMTGDKIKIEEVIGKDIEVIGYKISNSKYQKEGNGKVLTLQFNINGVSRILFTGSNVLLEQVEKYKNEIPFLTKIDKVNKFYTFT